MQPKLTILYAEDEPLISAMVEDSLVSAGFEVIVAHDGDHAHRLAREHIDRLAGLITDIRLGAGPDGWDLARQCRASSPTLPVIYTSGDSAHVWTAEGVPMSVMIQKPFVEAQIITALAELLNDRPLPG